MRDRYHTKIALNHKWRGIVWGATEKVQVTPNKNWTLEIKKKQNSNKKHGKKNKSILWNESGANV